MSTLIYIVRHAEVENPKNIEYMRLPGFGISDFGKKQAQEVGQFLRLKGIDRIYASPLKRTKETAKIISDGKIPIRYSEGLIEANFKKWQGLKKEDRNPKEVEGYHNDPVKYSAILGEALTDIQKRVLHEIFENVAKHQGERIVFVTHAAPVVVARLFFENRPLQEYSKTYVAFASITTIRLNDELECSSIHYHEYVKQNK